MRLFVSVNLPQSVQAGLTPALASFAQTLRGVGDFHWAIPAQLHFTLKFLGECQEQRMPSLQRRLRAALKEESRFDLEMAGLGTFPPKGDPRVLWIALRRGGDALARLAARVEAASHEEGFALEDRPYHPHLTLARVTALRDRGALQRLMAETAETPFGRFTVSNVCLMRSRLLPRGSVYDAMDQFSFGVEAAR